MKNNPTEPNYQGFPFFNQNDFEDNNKTPKLSRKAVKELMTKQRIAPPAHVWDKIEQVLDQQDLRKGEANKIIASTFSNKQSDKKRKILAAAGVTFVAGILLILF